MGGVAGFALQVTQNGHGPVVLLAGELDLAAAGQFRECLHGLIGEHITLDFSDVTFMDSSALGVLIAAQQRCEIAGGKIVLHDVQLAQMRIFEIAGLVDSMNFDGDATPTLAQRVVPPSGGVSSLEGTERR